MVFKLIYSSDYSNSRQVTIKTIKDLLALKEQEGHDLIIRDNCEGNKVIEVYDDYRE
jgi:cystathionine beta-lyase family protein involved in aluminum resistance